MNLTINPSFDSHKISLFFFVTMGQRINPLTIESLFGSTDLSVFPASGFSAELKRLSIGFPHLNRTGCGKCIRHDCSSIILSDF
jgi:hypothetical protein